MAKKLAFYRTNLAGESRILEKRRSVCFNTLTPKTKARKQSVSSSNTVKIKESCFQNKVWSRGHI